MASFQFLSGVVRAASLALLVAAGAAHCAPAAAQAVSAPDVVEDHVVALVQAGKCDAAKDAAEKGGQPRLAEQVGEMCGAKASGGSGGGGGRTGSSSRGGGRKGGSSSASGGG